MSIRIASSAVAANPNFLSFSISIGLLGDETGSYYFSFRYTIFF